MRTEVNVRQSVAGVHVIGGRAVAVPVGILEKPLAYLVRHVVGVGVTPGTAWEHLV